MLWYQSSDGQSQRVPKPLHEQSQRFAVRAENAERSDDQVILLVIRQGVQSCDR